MTEITLLHMLALYRQVRRLARNQETHTWERFLPYVLETRIVAILGLGAIAEHMARCFKALGMTVYGISRTNRLVEGVEKVFSRDQIADAVSEIDFLIALVPHNSETDKIVNAEVFDAMKPSACLINVARGGVVDEAALIEAIKTGKIAGAGLDVTDPEPMSSDDPLLQLPNCVVVPHVASATVGTRMEMAMMCVDNVLAGVRGEFPPYCVNKDAIAGRSRLEGKA